MRSAVASLWGRTLLFGATRVGRAPSVRGRPHVECYGRLVIGDELHLDSSIVQSHLVVGPKGTLEIGNNVRIAYGAAIAAHAHIRIGDGATLGPFVMLLDTDFHHVGQRDVLPEGEPIVIGEGAKLGSRVTVLPGAHIGAGARIREGSVVSGSIPPGADAGGIPARVLSPESDGHQGDHHPAMSVAERVQRTVAGCFGLSTPPPLTDGPSEIPSWDSLGALRLLLALEEAFALSLHEEELMGASTVGDLVGVIEKRAPAMM